MDQGLRMKACTVRGLGLGNWVRSLRAFFFDFTLGRYAYVPWESCRWPFLDTSRQDSYLANRGTLTLLASFLGLWKNGLKLFSPGYWGKEALAIYLHRKAAER